MILTIGDSYTYGDELNDTNNAWPYVLAKKLGTTVNNLGKSGSSNDRIFRLAITETLTTPYDIVICAWTELSRLDLVVNGAEFQVTSASHWHHSRYPWIKEYYANHYDEGHAAKTWLTKILALQGYFKFKNQRYLFTSMNGRWDQEAYYKQFKLYDLYKSIDQLYYVDWISGNGMTVWQGDCPKGPKGHPLELGHQRIAEKINEHIRHLGWVS